jgi:hypothetical protein
MSGVRQARDHLCPTLGFRHPRPANPAGVHCSNQCLQPFFLLLRQRPSIYPFRRIARSTLNNKEASFFIRWVVRGINFPTCTETFRGKILFGVVNGACRNYTQASPLSGPVVSTQVV